MPQAALEGLLQEPSLSAEATTVSSGGSASALQLRFLVLKNLAALLAEDDSSAAEALRLYGEAAALEQDDVILWNRMGTLVRTGVENWGIWGWGWVGVGVSCRAQRWVLERPG